MNHQQLQQTLSRTQTPALKQSKSRSTLQSRSERQQSMLINSLNQEVTEKNLLIQHLNETMITLKEQVQRSQNRQALIQQSYDDLERDYNQVIKRLNTSEVEKLHQQQIEQKEVLICQLQTELKAKTDQIRMLNENLETLESRNKLYLAQLEEITSYKQAIAQLTKDNQVLQNQLTDVVSQLEKLSKDETDYKKLAFKYDTLQQQNFQENAAFKTVKTELNTTIDRQRIRIRTVTDKVISISQNNAFELLQVKKTIQGIKATIQQFRSRLLSADAANILYMQVNAIILDKHKDIEKQLLDSQESAVKTALSHFKQQTLNSLQKLERPCYQFSLPKIIQYQNQTLDSPDKIEALVTEHKALTVKLSQADNKITKLEQELQELKTINQALQQTENVFNNSEVDKPENKTENETDQRKLPKERLGEIKEQLSGLLHTVIKEQSEIIDKLFDIRKILKPEVSYAAFIQYNELCSNKVGLEAKIEELKVLVQTMQEQQNSGKFIDMLGQITIQTVDPIVKICELVFEADVEGVDEILAQDTFVLERPVIEEQ